jgi:hypothetical protein
VKENTVYIEAMALLQMTTGLAMSKNILLSILLGILFSVNVAYGEECLSYEPAQVTLKGTLVRKILPGPPEFESVEKGDRPETYWILKLSKPVCVNEDPNDEINFEDSRDVRRMHLVINTEDYSRYGHFMSKEVVVTGILFHKYSGYDHTRVLEVISIKPAKGEGKK